MAYIQFTPIKSFYRIIKNDTLKEFYKKEIGTFFEEISNDQFNKLKFGRLNIPLYNSSTNLIIWEPEITNNSTIKGDDNLDYIIIHDLNKLTIDKEAKEFIKHYELREYLKNHPNFNLIEEYKNWLQININNNWNNFNFPVTGKTRFEFFQENYNKEIFNLIEL